MALAVQTQVSDGSLTTIPVGIDFMEQADIQVYFDLGASPLTAGVDYSWTASKTITFSNAVPAGTTVFLLRQTQVEDMLNIFDGGAGFTRYTLDENFRQILLLAQEVREGVGLRGIFLPLDLHGYQIKNLGTGTLPTDAVNLQQVQALCAQVVSGYQAGDANLQRQISGGSPLEASAFSPISWHAQTIQNSVSIPANKNAWSFGPKVAIAPGQAVTVGEGSVWTIAEGDEQDGGLDMSAYVPKADLAASTGAGLVGYKSRTARAKLDDHYSVLDFPGVVKGADSTGGIQAALTALGSVVESDRRNLSRSLDLCGGTYLVSAPLSLAGCDGLRIHNGTLKVLPSTPLPVNRAVLEHTVPNVELWGLVLDCVTIQCSQVANGINLQRHQAFRFLNSIILGWGQREYGLQMGPLNYSADACIINPRISGFAVAYSDNPVATRTGVGIVSDTADTMIMGGNIDTGKKCVKITSSTSVYNSHIWNGNPGNEALAEANNVGLEVSNDAACLFTGITFDNCCVVMLGQCLFKSFVGNKFYSNQQQLSTGVIFKASAAGQALADFNFTNNQMHGYYNKPITLDTTAGTYTALGRTVVKDNPLRSYAAGLNGYGSSLCATIGEIIVYCGTGNFNASGVIRINLGKHLLMPAYGDVLDVRASIIYDSRQSADTPNAVQFARYDSTTGILSVKCTAAYNGRMGIYFDQSYTSLLVTPEPTA